MLEETKLFYQNLYSKRNKPTDDDFTETITHINFNTHWSWSTHWSWNYSEALTFLKSMKMDGFTAELLHYFMEWYSFF